MAERRQECSRRVPAARGCRFARRTGLSMRGGDFLPRMERTYTNSERSGPVQPKIRGLVRASPTCRNLIYSPAIRGYRYDWCTNSASGRWWKHRQRSIADGDVTFCVAALETVMAAPSYSIVIPVTSSRRAGSERPFVA